MEEQEIIEKLAELEHEQWMSWSKNLAQKEKLSGDCMTRWEKLWTPYSNLTEKQKEQDREWARKTLRLFNSINLINSRGSN